MRKIRCFHVSSIVIDWSLIANWWHYFFVYVTVISSKPAQTPAYLSALNPTDQIFDWEELEYYYLVANRKPSDDNTDSEPEQESAQDEIEASPPKKRKNKNKAAEVKKEPIVEVVKEPLPPKPEIVDKPQIDNPFLKSLSLAWINL